MQDANIQNTQDNVLTTDDLILIIGEKEVNLFQNRKLINNLKNKILDLTQQTNNSEILIQLEKELNEEKIKNNNLKHEYESVINRLNQKIANLRIQLKEKENNLEYVFEDDNNDIQKID